jgi:tungstate transport system ATP-binding protein
LAKEVAAPLLELRNVSKSYGGKVVLDVERLTVPRGQALSILGPNGAGKSTLLRIMNLIEPLDEGEVFYRGRPYPFPAPLGIRRQISMVFQRPLLFNRSVRENVAYGLKLRGEVEKGRVDHMLEQLDLLSLAGENARSLSGGEIQRVALARALVLEPTLLLLDEPAANLDPFNAELIEAIIHAVLRERQTTVVVVSHNLHQALRIADRVALLFHGRIVEVQDAEILLDEAQDPRSKAFLRSQVP